ncbi:MAG TPA: c-type cytochrome [Candidatus Bathyarchaeia archaeon]|nr:c-type cytochrome [Candidatus Bathyarchaeia archaeon]
MKGRTTAVLAGGLIVAAALVSAAPVARASEAANKQLYLKYCGSCHGPDGKGDGVLSGVLQTKPADLTQIAKKNGGEFPTAEVAKVINGSKTMRAHGDPDMPVWGEVFKQQASSGSSSRKSQAQAKIAFITAYIKSIQEK